MTNISKTRKGNNKPLTSDEFDFVVPEARNMMGIGFKSSNILCTFPISTYRMKRLNALIVSRFIVVIKNLFVYITRNRDSVLILRF